MPITAPITIPKPESRKEFDPLPEDVYDVEIKDLEYRQSRFLDEETKEPKMEINVTFSVLEQQYAGRLLWRSVSPFVSAPDAKKMSLLTQLSAASLGHALTLEEAERFYTDSQGFLNDLIGKRMRVTVIQKKSGDKTFNNVSSFLKAKEVPQVPF